jgi:flagellar hook-length control protein FliK
MSVSSIASKSNVAAPPRLPDMDSRRWDDAPDLETDGFGALLGGSDGTTPPARPEQPAPPVASRDRKEGAARAAKDVSAPAAPDGNDHLTTAAVDAQAVQNSDSAAEGTAKRKIGTLKHEGASGEAIADASPDAAASGDATSAATATAQTDSAGALLAGIVPPSSSAASTPATTADMTTDAAAEIASATAATAGDAEAALHKIAATQVQGSPASDAVLGTLPAATGSASGDPALAQLSANARIGATGRSNARGASAKATDAQSAPRAGATSDAPASSSATAGADAQAAVTHAEAASQGQRGDTGERKARGQDGAVAKIATDASAVRVDTATPIVAGSASIALAAHGADASQNATLAASSSQAAATAAPALGSAPATAHAAAAYAAGVPISALGVEIAARARDGKNRFEIRLDPPDLGRIDVRLDVDRQGHVTSRLVVERSETLDLLKRDAPSLERALQSAGLKTDGGLEFSLRDQSLARDRSAQGTSAPINTPLPDDDSAPAAVAQRSYWRLGGAGSGVDISV